MEKVEKKAELGTPEDSHVDGKSNIVSITGRDVHKESGHGAAEGKSVIPFDDDKKKAPSAPKVAFAEQREKSPDSLADREAVLARLATEKRLALIKAWEESEKSKAENKAYKKIAAVQNWENCKRASVEAKLKKIEENLEKKKAEYAERMKNKIASLHKAAEEKRALVQAKKGQDLVKIEEEAKKFRARGQVPKNFLGCFCSSSS